MDKDILRTYQQIADSLISDTGIKKGWERSSGLPELIEDSRRKKELADKKIKFLLSLYQADFGIPEEVEFQNIHEADVMEAEAYFDEEQRKPFVFKIQHGLFSKKPKKTDYERALRYARLVSQFYEQLGQKQNELLKRVEHSDQIIEDYAQSVAVQKINTREWGEFRNPDGSNSGIYIGDILQPLVGEEDRDAYAKSLITKLRARSLLDQSNEWLRVPFAYQGNRPFVLYIDYSSTEAAEIKNDGRFKPVDLIHNIIYQVVHSMPMYTYEFTYFDPEGAGASLGELQMLNNAVNGNAFWLHEDIFASVYRLFQIVRSTEDVPEELKKLNDYIGEVNQARENQTLSEYNSTRIHDDGTFTDDAAIIPRKFIIFENIDQFHDDAQFEHILTLIKNAEGCGISAILVSRHRFEKDNPNKELESFKAKLKDEKNVDILTWIAQENEDFFHFSPCGQSMGKTDNETYEFNMQIFNRKINEKLYLQQLCKALTPDLNVETRYEKVIDWRDEWGKGCADDCIELPIGVNIRKQVKMMTFGDSKHAHAILTGLTGCGKSTFLHSLINSVIVRYRPDDVQLWLADFKANEFSRYMTDTPPHIRFVSADRSKEFAISFLKKIYDEHLRRMNAFGPITSLRQYREVNGSGSMPRIFVIVDEFHVLSGHIVDEPAYKGMLEDILKEARAFGITILLSDQTCGVGLHGLTESAKLQLTGRLAMKTVTEEYNAIFNISNAKDVIPELQPYEIIVERIRTRKNSMGQLMTSCYYERNKTLNNGTAIREEIARKSIVEYGPSIDPEFIVGDKKTKADWREIALEEKKKPVRRGIPLYLGVPCDMGKFFRISCFANYGQNLMCISEKTEQNKSVLISVITSIRTYVSKYKIIIIASENDELFWECQDSLYSLQMQDPHIIICLMEEDVCRQIAELYDEMMRRFKVRTPEEEWFIFWIGMDDLSRTFDHYDLERPESLKKNKKSSSGEQQEDLDRLFDLLFNEEPVIREDNEDNIEDAGQQMLVYNANDEISELIKDGPKKDIYSFAFFSSISGVRRSSCLKRIYENEFNHKIAFRMSKDDAEAFLGRSNLILAADGNMIDEDTAVYYDGKEGKRFVPFALEQRKE